MEVAVMHQEDVPTKNVEVEEPQENKLEEVESQDNSESSSDIDKLGFSEDQLEYVASLRKDRDQLKTEKEHWETVTNTHRHELGRLRKLEKTLVELDQEDVSLKNEEQKEEYDVEKLADIKAKRMHLGNERESVQGQLAKMQVSQKVPDFEQLVSEGFIREVVDEIGKANGISTYEESNMLAAINALRINPSQALMVAQTARVKKQLKEIKSKNDKIVSNNNNLSQKLNSVSEEKIITGGRSSSAQYSVSQLMSMSSEQLKAVIEKGKKRGLLHTK